MLGNRVWATFLLLLEYHKDKWQWQVCVQLWWQCGTASAPLLLRPRTAMATAVQQSTDISYLPGPKQQTCHMLLQRANRRDRRTDTLPLQRPCTAYYANSADTERRCAENYNKWYNTVFLNSKQQFGSLSNQNSFWVSSDKIASVYFSWKTHLHSSTGNGQPREPALCQLYRHTSTMRNKASRAGTDQVDINAWVAERSTTVAGDDTLSTDHHRIFLHQLYSNVRVHLPDIQSHRDVIK